MNTRYKVDTSGIPKNSELSDDAKKLYQALLEPELRTDETGSVIAGNADLALYSGVKQSKISSILKVLAARRLIDVEYENIRNSMGEPRRLRWITIL